METEKQTSLDDELLSLLADQARVSPFNMIAAMGIVSYLIYPHVSDSPFVLFSWLLLVIISQIYRRYRLLKLQDHDEIPIKNRIAEARRVQQVCSFIMALSFIAFPILTPFEASVMTMFFLAMGVGSIVATLGWPPYAKAHIFGHLYPLFLLWAWSGYWGSAGVVGYLVAAIGFLYGATMLRFSKNLFHMNEELFANKIELLKAVNVAEAAGDAKSRFLAAASHDLRQPVHTLSLLSATLNRRANDDKTKAISLAMEDAIKALSAELDSLLDISKLDAGVVALKRTNFDLRECLERLVNELQARFALVENSLRLDSPDSVFCYTDQTLLERIVRNLLENAVIHTNNCEVLVRVETAGNFIRLSVSDTGNGIPVEEQERIFEEFYQINNPERDRSKGLGLGLPIVKRLAEKLDIGMEFTSKPGTGTEFSFSLIRSDGSNLQEPKVIDNYPSLNGLNVLIVDDEVSVLEATKNLLEDMGCNVQTAENTPEAIAVAGQKTPDIAILDYRLRGADGGLETYERLREISPGIPTLIVSGETAPDRLRKVKAAGLTLLTKPVDKDLLYETILAECSR